MVVTKVVGDVVSGYISEGTFITGELITGSVTGFASNLNTVTNVTNLGLFTFGETVTNFAGDTAIVEQINLETGQETPLADLRFGIGAATTTIDLVSATDATQPVPDGTIVATDKIQIGSEIILANLEYVFL